MVLTSNILSYYKLDGDAVDAVGTSNGTISGATSVTGKINNAYSFDGSNDYISTNNNAINSGDVSISYWYKSTSTALAVIIGCDGNDRLEIIHNISTGKIRIYTKVSNVAIVKKISDTIANLNDGNWHHVVIYFAQNSTTGSRLYFDGSNVTLNNDGTQSTGSITNLSYNIYLGASADSGSGRNFFTGTIDEVGIWTREITSTEASELYNSGSGLQYPFTTGYSVKVYTGSAFESKPIKVYTGSAWESKPLKVYNGSTWEIKS